MTLPLPPRLSAPPLVGNALEFRRDPIALLWRGYRECGPVFSFRLGPMPAVVLLGGEHQRFFFNAPDATLSMSAVYKVFEPVFGKGFTLAAGPAEYREQRAILQPAFEPSRMADYVAVFGRAVSAWADTLGAQGAFELSDAFERVCLDVVSVSLLGPEFRRQMGDDFFERYRDVVGAIDFLIPWFVPIPKFRRRDRSRRLLHDRIGAVLARRRDVPDPTDDLLQRLATAHYSDGRPVPDATLKAMTLFLVFSASESTPLQAAWSLIQLLQHPDYLSGVREEVDPLWGGDDGRDPAAVAPDDLARLERLQWALWESERLRPMTTMLWRRTEQPYEVGGYRVPKGWITVISPAVTHRIDPAFPDPDAYNPRRFAERRPSQCGHALAGFGGGAHRCPGSSFAANLMKTLIGLLVARYDLELDPPEPRPDFSTTITKPQSPCLVLYRRRSAVAVAAAGPTDPGGGGPMAGATR